MTFLYIMMCYSVIVKKTKEKNSFSPFSIAHRKKGTLIRVSFFVCPENKGGGEGAAAGEGLFS